MYTLILVCLIYILFIGQFISSLGSAYIQTSFLSKHGAGFFEFEFSVCNPIGENALNLIF